MLDAGTTKDTKVHEEISTIVVTYSALKNKMPNGGSVSDSE
jgi:hypothetical protein